ncbi:MAG: helix-hairpin-helix domain-containing protein [Bacteroidetes bacterium]|nr:helix-hairpin-helix domain-containing protein [Bacteroidota bacterium]
MPLAPIHDAQPSFSRSQRSQAPHPVNLNTASVTELATLPGIGEKTAEKIIERRKMRPFRTPEDIMDVRGIGQKKFERMRPFLRVQ